MAKQRPQDLKRLPWKKIAAEVYHATSPWGLYTVRSMATTSGKRWEVSYPDGYWAWFGTPAEAKLWAESNAELRAARVSHSTKKHATKKTVAKDFPFTASIRLSGAPAPMQTRDFKHRADAQAWLDQQREIADRRGWGGYNFELTEHGKVKRSRGHSTKLAANYYVTIGTGPEAHADEHRFDKLESARAFAIDASKAFPRRRAMVYRDGGGFDELLGHYEHGKRVA
jgi:hypothetical protein